MNLEFVEIDSSPLAWRWNSPTHGDLSLEELSQIHPLSERAATHLHETLKGYSFEDQIKFDASGKEEAVSHWLEDSLPREEKEIILLWEPTVGILTKRELFIRKWDDFCYPSSDDIDIFPQSNNFLLRYSHFEVFEFSSR